MKGILKGLLQLILPLLLVVTMGTGLAEAGQAEIDVSNLLEYSTPQSGQAEVTVRLKEDELTKILEGSPEGKIIYLRVKGPTAFLNLSWELVNTFGNRNLQLKVKVDGCSFLVPLNEIRPIKLAAGSLNIRCGSATSAQVKALQARLVKEGLPLTEDAFQFSIEGADGSDRNLLLCSDSYIQGYVDLNQYVESSTTATGVILTPESEISPIPTQFTELQGKQQAIVIFRNSGIFTVTNKVQTFDDTRGHWAEQIINSLASKLIISGKRDQNFEPDRGITRAEFASLVTRAMGIVTYPNQGSFTDVRSTNWYYGAVIRAADSGLIKGYINGSYKPDQLVTREQVAAVLVCCLSKVDKTELGKVNENIEVYRDQELLRFTDYGSVSPWAIQAVKLAVDQGILQGNKDGALRPKHFSTRAETVAMLAKTLKIAGLIPPTSRVTAPVEGLITNRTEISVSGEAELWDSVQVNGKPVNVDPKGRFNTFAALYPGSNTIEIKFIDSRGNLHTIVRKVTVDKNLSDIEVLEPADRLLTKDFLLTVKGIALAGGTVKVNGHKVEVDRQGNFKNVVRLNPGRNELTISLTDENRNERVITRTVTYDNKAPELVVDTPDKEMNTGLNLTVVAGYTEPNSQLEINGKVISTDPKGNFSKPLDLEVESNPIIISATDKAGNRTTVTHYVYFDENRVSNFGVPSKIKLESGAGISFAITNNGFVTIKIYDSDNRLVRRLLDDKFKAIGSHSEKWDGRDADGEIAEDGEYRFLVELRDNEGDIIGCREVNGLAARMPYLSVYQKLPKTFNPLTDYLLSEIYEITSDALITAKILQGSKVIRTIVNGQWKGSGKHSVDWDGKDDAGNRVSDGNYSLLIEAVNPFVDTFKSQSREFFQLEGVLAEDNFGKISKVVIKYFTVQKGPLSRIQTAEVTKLAGAPLEITDFTVTPNPLMLGITPAYIRYNLSQGAEVKLQIKDDDGNLVSTLFSGERQAAGNQFVRWEGRDSSGNLVPEGEYTLTLSLNNELSQQLAFSAGYYAEVKQFTVVPADNSNPREAIWEIKYSLSTPSQITLEVLNSRRTVIKTIVPTERQTEGDHRTLWDGKDDSGKPIGDGQYTIQVKSQSQVVPKFKTLYQAQVLIERNRPDIQNVLISPDPFQITYANFRVNYFLNEGAAVTFKFKNNQNEVVRTVNVAGNPGNNSFYWDGKDQSGNTVPEGTYTISILAVDSFGNASAEIVKGFLAGSQPRIENATFEPSPFNPLKATDNLSVNFQVTSRARITVEVMNYRRSAVRNLISDDINEAGLVTASWDGKDERGQLVPDGTYYIRINAVSPAVPSFKSYVENTVIVEKEQPIVYDVRMLPAPFLIYKIPVMAVRYELKETAHVCIEVFNKDQHVKTLATNEKVMAGPGAITWNGTDKDGRIVPSGRYTVVIRATDAAGKTGEVKRNVAVYPYPQVVSAEPSQDAIDAAIGKSITLTFCDRVVMGRTFEEITFKVEGKDIPFTSKVSGENLIISPSVKMAYGTTYSLHVPADAVRDYNGKSMETPYSLTFTTEAVPREVPSGTNVDLSSAASAAAMNEGERAIVRLKLDHQDTIQIIDEQETIGVASIPVTIWADLIEATISGKTIKSLADKGALIELQTKRAALQIPASTINLELFAQQLDSEIDDLQIKMIININEANARNTATKLALKNGLLQFSGPVEFNLEVSNGQRAVKLDRFDRHINFVIVLPQKVNGSYIVGGRLLNNDLIPTPTQLKIKEDSSLLIIKSQSTGTFAPVSARTGFKDLKSHWAVGDINSLASKLILSGMTPTTYAPQRGVTRAQFAVILAKALGLKPGTTRLNFNDTKAEAWYAGYLSAALEADLISGYSDGTFRPNSFIRRQEAAAMLTQALKVAGLSVTAGTGSLDRFKDGLTVSSWAREHVAGAAQSGVINGYPNGFFKPGYYITRAETAVMVKKLMQRAGFI